MAPARKVSEFYREGNDWFCNGGLPSDITVIIEGINFHLHKFPLISKCGKIAKFCQESHNVQDKTFTIVFEEVPGGPETFLIIVKFCYGVRIELTPKNLALIYCTSDYLEMTDEYGEDNLLFRCDNFFHKNILPNWKNCVLVLQSCEFVVPRAEKLQIISKLLNALSMMVCTDPSLFGWPMRMYGSLQSPGGSILWNGINTGAKIRSSGSDWWFEDISCLSIVFFERLIKTMEVKGIRPENLSRVIMYYARKYLPGLGRWQSGHANFSLLPNTDDQKKLLDKIVNLLPERKSSSFCRFLLGLLRVALILGVDEKCKAQLEKRIGTQLEMATLEGLLIPSYSDSDCLYNTECVGNIINHFNLSEKNILPFSPSSFDVETSPSNGWLIKVAKLIDNYLAEVAADVNLKPEKFRSLAEAVPESSRYLHDGLYRALDIYLKTHNWLSEQEKEQLCTIINYQKLSIDACAHASQNERLPLRVVLQVLFFEQLHLRTALSDYLHVLDTQNPHVGPTTNSGVPRMAILRENPGFKIDMEQMSIRVKELEDEFSKIKEEMKRVGKLRSSIVGSPRVGPKRIGCAFVPCYSDVKAEKVESVGPASRVPGEYTRSSHDTRQRKKSSLV